MCLRGRLQLTHSEWHTQLSKLFDFSECDDEFDDEFDQAKERAQVFKVLFFCNNSNISNGEKNHLLAQTIEIHAGQCTRMLALFLANILPFLSFNLLNLAVESLLLNTSFEPEIARIIQIFIFSCLHRFDASLIKNILIRLLNYESYANLDNYFIKIIPLLSNIDRKELVDIFINDLSENKIKNPDKDNNKMNFILASLPYLEDHYHPHILKCIKQFKYPVVETYVSIISCYNITLFKSQENNLLISPTRYYRVTSDFPCKEKLQECLPFF